MQKVQIKLRDRLQAYSYLFSAYIFKAPGDHHSVFKIGVVINAI